MFFCLARVETLLGEVVEMMRSEVGIRSRSRMDWRTREPRLPDVPVKRTFIVGFDKCVSAQIEKEYYLMQKAIYLIRAMALYSCQPDLHDLHFQTSGSFDHKDSVFPET